MYLRGVKLVFTVSLLQDTIPIPEATTPLLVESSVSYSTCESKLLARMYQATVIQREYKPRVDSTYVGLPQLQFSFNPRPYPTSKLPFLSSNTFSFWLQITMMQ